MKHQKSSIEALSEVWRALCALSVLFSVALVCSTGRADIVTDWNQRAVATLVFQRVTGGALPARTLAMMHTAMFNAVNAVSKDYKLYAVAALPESPDASPDAAAYTAARRVLAELYTKEKAALDATFDAAIANLPDGPAKVSGMLAGEQAAMAVLAARKTVGFDSPNTYRPVTTSGSYVPTAPLVMSQIAGIKPFALKSISQFRPGPHPRARPEGNITGLTKIIWELSGKRLELLKETVPKLTRVAVLWDPGAPGSRQWEESQTAARELGLQLHSMEVRSAKALESAFKGAMKARSTALPSSWWGRHYLVSTKSGSLISRLRIGCRQSM